MGMKQQFCLFGDDYYVQQWRHNGSWNPFFDDSDLARKCPQHLRSTVGWTCSLPRDHDGPHIGFSSHDTHRGTAEVSWKGL